MLRFTAEITPIGTAIMSDRASAASASSMVAGKRSSTSGSAGCLEAPRATEITLQQVAGELRNCSHIGRSKPICLLNCGDVLARGVRRQQQQRRIAAQEHHEEDDEDDGADHDDGLQKSCR